MTNLKTEIILALDVDTNEQANEILDQVGDQLTWVKIGLQSYLRDGPKIIEKCVESGKKIFLDLKLHDIPNTMSKAIESLSRFPISMLTLHTCSGSEAMSLCKDTAQEFMPDATLLGVTVLTSMNQANLNSVGIMKTPEEQVLHLAKLANKSGLEGIVCSPQELVPLRSVLPREIKMVTPGIRPAGSHAGDQKRTLTPREAQQAGADYLVVGRPILTSPNPAEAIEFILKELNE